MPEREEDPAAAAAALELGGRRGGASGGTTPAGRSHWSSRSVYIAGQLLGLQSDWRPDRPGNRGLWDRPPRALPAHLQPAGSETSRIRKRRSGLQCTLQGRRRGPDRRRGGPALCAADMRALWPALRLAFWGRGARRCGTAAEQQHNSTASSEPTFGLLFDIDGVLVRGKTPIPAARKAFQKLVNPQGHFMVPVIFVTNAGNCLRQSKADQLSQILGVPISQDQVMMSHSPLRMFRRYHDKCVLVSGQGPLLDIAKYLGFSHPVTIDMLRETYPMLDMVDHSRRPKILPSPAVDVPKIEAVVLFGEPIRWETNLQLIIDVLLTSGRPGDPHQQFTYPHIPLLACNMDLMWMSEAQSPRFGHGTFMVCLENVYKKITGKDLKYEALMGKPSEVTYHYAEYLIRAQAAERQWKKPIQTLYAIGDNLMTDIYGANLYNRYLEEKNSRKGSKARIQASAGTRASTVSSQDVEASNTWEGELSSSTATNCRSVLVCTGIYNPHTEVPLDTRECITETVFHGHRDFRFDPGLVEPDHIVEDVDAAVELVLQLENFARDNRTS